MNKNKLWLLAGVFVACGVLADQALHHLFMSEGKLFGRRVAPFEPPIFYENQEQALRRLERHLETGQVGDLKLLFDAELGWCPPRSGSLGGKTFGEWGARLSPELISAERTPDVTRVATFGCSFTLGDEVGDDETWAYRLDEGDEALEIANLGMSGYGLDQAWLRYRRDGRRVAPDEVWLGWLPLATLRLGTLYRPVARHWTGPILFKPRFRLAGDGLQLVENPARTLQDVHRLLTTQADFYEALKVDDLWVSRTPAAYAPTGSSWLHHSGFGRAWLAHRERGARDPAQWMQRDGSELRELVRRIVLGMRDEVEADGARFRLLILPDRGVLEQSVLADGGYWKQLTDDLALQGVEVIDLCEACARAGMIEDDEAWAAGGHFSAKGNAVIAEALAGVLAE